MSALDRISGFKQLNSENSWKTYAKIGVNDTNTMDRDERAFALHGWRFTQPDTIPEGFNTLTAGNFEGLLNMHGKYDENGEAPKRTFCAIG